VVFLALAVLTIPCAAAIAQRATEAMDEPAARGLLERIESRFLETRAFRVEFEARYRLAYGDVGPHASKAENSRGEIRLDGDRLEVIRRDEKLDEPSGAFVPVREEHFVWNDGRGIGLRRFVAGRSSEQAFTTLAKFHDAVRPDMIGWFADGIVIHSEHFSTTLLAADSLQAVREAGDNGEALVHFSGETRYGAFEAWVTVNDPSLLRKIKFVATPEYAATLVDVDGVTIAVAITRYETIDGRSLPAAAEAVYSHEIPGAGRIDKAIAVERHEYEIAPDWVSLQAFRVPLADGTHVVDYDDAEIRHVWRGGMLTRVSGPSD
jgi:hypothetical protein